MLGRYVGGWFFSGERSRIHTNGHGWGASSRSIEALRASEFDIGARAEAYLRTYLIDRLSLSDLKVINVKPTRLTLQAKTPKRTIALRVFSSAYKRIAERLVILQPSLAGKFSPPFVHVELGTEIQDAYGVNSLAWDWIEGEHYRALRGESHEALIELMAEFHDHVAIPIAAHESRNGSREGFDLQGDEFVWPVTHFYNGSRRNLNRLAKALPKSERDSQEVLLERLEASSNHVFDCSRHLSMVHGDINFSNIIERKDRSLKLIDFDGAGLAPFSFELAELALRLQSQGGAEQLVETGLAELSSYSAANIEPIYFRHRRTDMKGEWEACRSEALLRAYAKILGQELTEFRRQARTDRSARKRVSIISCKLKRELLTYA